MQSIPFINLNPLRIVLVNVESSKKITEVEVVTPELAFLPFKKQRNTGIDIFTSAQGKSVQSCEPELDLLIAFSFQGDEIESHSLSLGRQRLSFRERINFFQNIFFL